MLHGEHLAILSTLINLPFVIKIFAMSIFEWRFNTGLTYVFTEKEDDENGSGETAAMVPFLTQDHTSCALIQMFDRHATSD